ncbi:tetratricopeptide repeat protein [Croceibacterium xixiisoli]|nr:tetratricopeptide repeat protein [Croceibacterium xixiisoli]
MLLSTMAAAAPQPSPLDAVINALARGDGIAAEARARAAREAGIPDIELNAYFGEAALQQGRLADARRWLAPGAFSDASFESGFHALARLEMQQGNFPAAARAFDKVLSRGRGSAQLWVDIGRMRYRSGEQSLAFSAATRALERDPNDPRALEFRGQLARDAEGLKAALSWFERGVEAQPEDMGLLGEYAATLGELGRNADMLVVARKMVQIDRTHPRAYFLQAVLAGRTGHDDLARRLLLKTGESYQELPAVILLGSALELRSGNPAQAIELLDPLVRRQPDNRVATLLLARALLASGEANELLARFRYLADRPDASPYELTLVGRALEHSGQRKDAAAYLDRAAAGPQRVLVALAVPRGDDLAPILFGTGPIPMGVMEVRQRAGRGEDGSALDQARQLVKSFPASGDVAELAGDAALMAGRAPEALAHYEDAAAIRRNWALVERMATAYREQRRDDAAALVLSDFLRQNPREAQAAAMLARIAASQREWDRAAGLLRYAMQLERAGADSRLFADLAVAELQTGQKDQAVRLARRAYALQRTNGRLSLIYGRALQNASNSQRAALLLAKANSIGKLAEPVSD